MIDPYNSRYQRRFPSSRARPMPYLDEETRQALVEMEAAAGWPILISEVQREVDLQDRARRWETTTVEIPRRRLGDPGE